MTPVDQIPAQRTAEWTVLAHLLRPQGRKGELLAELLTDFPQRFSQRERVFLAPPEFAGAETDARPIEILSHWLPVGRNQGRVVLGFAGILSINQAEEIVGLEVIVPATDRVELEDDAEYISDLLDCMVYDGPHAVGRVAAVDFPTTPDGSRRLADAAPLLTLVTETGDEILVPYVQAFLVSLSTENKRIDMKLPEGLLELNRSEFQEPSPEIPEIPDTPDTPDTPEIE